MNLAQEYHPQPKPAPRLKKSKTKEWEEARGILKKEFTTMGITSCELQLPGCWHNTALGFAHADKRRNLGPGELFKVILICNQCHAQIEYLPKGQMKKIVLETIANRK